MNRHPTDVLALVFGVAFAVCAGAALAHTIGDVDFDFTWVAAGTLILLGVVAVAATLTRREPTAEAEPEEISPPD
jgi:hypothetical protein